MAVCHHQKILGKDLKNSWKARKRAISRRGYVCDSEKPYILRTRKLSSRLHMLRGTEAIPSPTADHKDENC